MELRSKSRSKFPKCLGRSLALVTYVATICFFVFLKVDALLTVPCDKGWQPSNVSGTCYKLFNQPKTWADARASCAMNNSDLVKIIDSEMNKQIVEHIKSMPDPFWIGLFKPSPGGDYMWLDEEQKANWIKIDVHIDDHMCGQVDNKGIWVLEPCDTTAKYICEMRPVELCDHGYIGNAFTRSCIKLYRDRMDWTSARMICQEQGGDLAVVNDSMANTFLHDQLKQDVGNATYIGLHDTMEESMFRFLDFKDELMFTMWDLTQPDNQAVGESTSQDCVTINDMHTTEDMAWNDVDCKMEAMFLCEKYSTCENQRYGMLCLDKCPGCGGPNMQCNPRTKSCVSCGPGYQGLMCDRTCSNGTYGMGCSKKCSKNCAGAAKACNFLNGKCTDGCVAGFVGDLCDGKPAEDMTMIIIAAAGGGGGFLLLIILIVVLTKCKKRKKPAAVVETAPEPEPEVKEPEPEPEVEDVQEEEGDKPSEAGEETSVEYRSSKGSKGSKASSKDLQLAEATDAQKTE